MNATRLELRIGISEELETKLRRIQDLLAQKNKKSVSLEEAINSLSNEFLERNDPIQKAERSIERKEKKAQATQSESTASSSKSTQTLNQISQSLVPVPKLSTKSMRVPIPAALKHQVVLRDQVQCTHRDPMTQKRCFHRKWLDTHHIIPVSQGGTNELSNLITLCSTHHRIQHSSG